MKNVGIRQLSPDADSVASNTSPPPNSAPIFAATRNFARTPDIALWAARLYDAYAASGHSMQRQSCRARHPRR